MYKVTISKENDYLNKLSHLKIKNMINENDKISFDVSKKTMFIIEKEFPEAIIINNNKKKIMFIKRNLITIISIVIIAFLLINQNYIISEVSYINYDTENVDVTDYIKSKLNKIGPFYYLDDTINNINQELRSVFYKYEWIGIEKRGSIIFVEIVKEKEETRKEMESIPGNLISKYDSYIKMYHVEKGVVKIQEGMMVNKGDLLISGEITNYDKESEYVYPIGYVIGEVLEYKTITIEKKEVKIKRSGNIEKIKKTIFFNKEVINNSKFENYETIVKENFNFFNIFKRITLYNYELVESNNSYTEDEAIDYGKSIIKRNFVREQANDYEKIIFIDLVNINEDNDNFYLKYVVKSNRDITEFIPF